MISKGNVKKFCCDDISLIENYDKAINDKTQTWQCPKGFVSGRLTKEERRKREFNIIANSWLSYNAEYDKKVEESKK